MAMVRKVIGVDIDDVLAASAAGFAAYSNKRWGNTHKAEHYTEAWAEFWGVSTEEAMKRSDEYHASDAVSWYEHYQDAVPVLRKLGEKYKIVVITSRKKMLKDQTGKWLEKYFPGIFDEIHYAGIWDTDQPIEQVLRQTKADLAKQLAVTYLIDDQIKHCTGAAEAGMTALLFGDHPTIRSAKLSKGIVRVKDWQAVERYFDAQG